MGDEKKDGRLGPRTKSADRRSLACRIACRRELLESAKMLRRKIRSDMKTFAALGVSGSDACSGMERAAVLLEQRARVIRV